MYSYSAETGTSHNGSITLHIYLNSQEHASRTHTVTFISNERLIVVYAFYLISCNTMVHVYDIILKFSETIDFYRYYRYYLSTVVFMDHHMKSILPNIGI